MSGAAVQVAPRPRLAGLRAADNAVSGAVRALIPSRDDVRVRAAVDHLNAGAGLIRQALVERELVDVGGPVQ